MFKEKNYNKMKGEKSLVQQIKTSHFEQNIPQEHIKTELIGVKVKIYEYVREKICNRSK